MTTDVLEKALQLDPAGRFECLAIARARTYLTTVLLGVMSAMGSDPKITTTVSTKGQVILPKAIRSKRRWDAGTRLVVEDTPDGVLLKAAPLFKSTRSEDVFGMLKYEGPAKTIGEMDAAVTEEVKRRHARGRY